MFSNFTTSVNYTSTGESQRWHGEISSFEKFSYAAFVIMVFIGFVINLRVLYVVIVKIPRTRPATVLVAQISAISICFAFVSLFNLCDLVNFISLNGPAACGILGYVKTVFFSAFSTNVVAILYERIRTFRECQGNLLTNRLIILIWVIPLFFSIPSSVMVKPRSDQVLLVTDSALQAHHRFVGSCKSVPLLGSAVATVVYEFMKFLLFHVAVTIFVIYGLVKIRKKLKYLHNISPAPNERMLRKAHNIRFIYFHFITFNIIWLPVGFLSFARRTLNRIDDSYREENGDRGTPLNKCIAFSVFSYFILNPTIYLLLIEKNQVWTSYCCFCFDSNYPGSKMEVYSIPLQCGHCVGKNVDGTECINGAVEISADSHSRAAQQQIEGQTSRFSTLAVTTAVNDPNSQCLETAEAIELNAAKITSAKANSESIEQNISNELENFIHKCNQPTEILI